jgi:hypothetical protein
VKSTSRRRKPATARGKKSTAAGKAKKPAGAAKRASGPRRATPTTARLAQGLIVARMDPPPELESEFNDWYDSEHIAERLRVPGFLTARRLERRLRPRYAAMYDLDSLEVLQSAAYKNVSGDKRSPWTARMLKVTRLFDRRVYEQVLPRREIVREAQRWTALRVLPPDSVRGPIDAHVRQIRERKDACARLFVGHEKAAGEWLIVYTADSEATRDAVLAAGGALGGDVRAFDPYAREPIETDDITHIPADAKGATDAYYRRGYTDGLPIIPPSDELVLETLAMLPNRSAREVIGLMAPRQGEVTLEALAINAVMAGCRPEYFPIVVAAVEALLDPGFNLLGVQATTHPVTPMLIVNGPARYELGFNLSGNAFGEGTQANATVGRAIRLILRNVGGGRPGKTDFTTQGSPARYGMCVAENEEESPFPPLHVALGWKKEDTVVTVCQAEGPHNVNDHSSQTALSLLRMIAGTMATFGTNDLARGGHPALALGPEHAKMLGREGWTREKIQAWLCDNARVPPSRLPGEMQRWLKEREDIDKSAWTDAGIPVGNKPEDFVIFVAGSTGRHSAIIGSFGFGKFVSRRAAYVPTGQPAPLIPECDC